MKIRVTTQANQDINHVFSYISKENIQAAQNILNNIEKLIDNLSDYPKLGIDGRVKQTRELVVPKTPFIIVYEIDDIFINILSVIHTSKKWK